MKTTLEMPDALLRRAELEAQRQGITLDEWVRNTLAGALSPATPPVDTGARVEFPIFTSKEPGTLHITPEVLRQLELADDLRRSGLEG